MDFSKDLQPGVVVFGRVKGFPWWPAVVSCAPETSEWVKKDGRVWCLFFNDRTGAWLRTTEMRPFDAFHREECMVINRNNKGHKRFLDRIAEAVSCALSYAVTLPSSPELEEPVSTLAPWARDDVQHPPSTVTLRTLDTTKGNVGVSPLTGDVDTLPPSKMNVNPGADSKQRYLNSSKPRSIPGSSIRYPPGYSSERPDEGGQGMTHVSKKRDRTLIKEEECVSNALNKDDELASDLNRQGTFNQTMSPANVSVKRRARHSAPGACLDVGARVRATDRQAPDCRRGMDAQVSSPVCDEGRPRRKRMKSVRYDDFESPSATESRHIRGKREVDDTSGRVESADSKPVDGGVDPLRKRNILKVCLRYPRGPPNPKIVQNPGRREEREGGAIIPSGLPTCVPPKALVPAVEVAKLCPRLVPTKRSSTESNPDILPMPPAPNRPETNNHGNEVGILTRNMSSRVTRRSSDGGSSKGIARKNLEPAMPMSQRESDGLGQGYENDESGVLPRARTSSLDRERLRSLRSSPAAAVNGTGGDFQKGSHDAELMKASDAERSTSGSGECSVPANGVDDFNQNLDAEGAGKSGRDVAKFMNTGEFQDAQPRVLPNSLAVHRQFKRPRLPAVVNSRNGMHRRRPNEPARAFPTVPATVGPGGGGGGDRTDSEDDAEASMRPLSGSLEFAAEQHLDELVAYEPNKSPRTDGSRDAVGGQPNFTGDILRSLLQRVSELEKDVKTLKSRTVANDRSALGEDATAAGLKSALEAFASASASFALKRNFDSDVVVRALDALWPDDALPLAGTEGELLRSVARSLVMACCKRRDSLV